MLKKETSTIVWLSARHSYLVLLYTFVSWVMVGRLGVLGLCLAGDGVGV
jgi:hypothetical protein